MTSQDDKVVNSQESTAACSYERHYFDMTSQLPENSIHSIDRGTAPKVFT